MRPHVPVFAGCPDVIITGAIQASPSLLHSGSLLSCSRIHVPINGLGPSDHLFSRGTSLLSICCHVPAVLMTRVIEGLPMSFAHNTQCVSPQGTGHFSADACSPNCMAGLVYCPAAMQTEHNGQCFTYTDAKSYEMGCRGTTKVLATCVYECD